MNAKRLISVLRDVVIPVVTVATAMMVAVLNHSLAGLDQEMKDRITAVDIAIKEAQNERERVNAEREFSFRIYNLVKESIEEANEKKQEVARQFVIVMVDGELRNRLLGVLETSGTAAVQKETAQILQKERVFEREADVLSDPRATSPSFNWEDWDYDVFWCETSGPPAKAQAASIKTQIESEGAKGRIRVRELPASVNAKPGYGVAGYAIRRSENEAPQAHALKTLAEKVLADAGFTATFDLQPASESTQWYISAFICP